MSLLICFSLGIETLLSLRLCLAASPKLSLFAFFRLGSRILRSLLRELLIMSCVVFEVSNFSFFLLDVGVFSR